MDTIEVFYIVSHNWLSARSKFSVWHWMIDKLSMDCLETWGGSGMVVSTWYNSNSCCWWEKPNQMRCLISGYFFLNHNEIGRTEVISKELAKYIRSTVVPTINRWSSKNLVHCQVVSNKDSGTQVWMLCLVPVAAILWKVGLHNQYTRGSREWT